ncbi:subtilisin-like protease SBT1.9 [Impatiens glandulifera]|uniref:subtilisin-like protease SBT1.9 n=1 Tax=Impatiens glandulifera TaxID=253017 RepID=UPI001FB0F3B0|nr:subtilisin-like protease SBT1.9 [Impatiens glandulifera]
MASARFIVCLMLIILSVSAHNNIEEEEEEKETYIVHMDLTSMPMAFSTHHTWYLATISNSIYQTESIELLQEVESNVLLYSYTNSINGFSAILSQTHLQFLKNSPGYVSHMKDLPVKLDTTHSPDFLRLNNHNPTTIWPLSDYGQDIVIGFIDTGIWPESKSFHDQNMTKIPSTWKGECENTIICNNKLVGARFFNKGLLSHFSKNLTAHSKNSTRDTVGHGTHTSSTAAGNLVPDASYFGYANGTARGTAPRARVAMYKALWEAGAYMSDIIAAIDSAIQDGVDVISLSLGLNGVPLYKDPVAMATFAAIEKGIFVSTSAGNDGPYLFSLHNGIPWVLTVGAGTLDREFLGSVVLGNGNSIIGSTLYPGEINWPLNYSVPIVFMELCDDVNELKRLKGRIVVCHDKTGADVLDQVDNVQNSGVVAGAIFITNNTDLEAYLMSTFPTLFVSPRHGQTILDYIIKKKNKKKTWARMEFHKTTLIGTKPAPRVTSYSSRGPSESCPFVLKPDLIAPGAQILASWPDDIVAATTNSDQLFSKFNMLSGTSMSCPHVSGVAALLKDVHPTWSPAAIRSAMMTTSYTMDNDFNYVEDLGNENRAATPLDIGSGHIDPNRAIDPGLIYDVGTEDYINLLCGLNYTRKQIQTITRRSYECSSGSLDLNYPSFIAYFNKNDSSNSNDRMVQEFERLVTNVGEGKATYVAKVSPMWGGKLEVSVRPETLVFKEKNEKQKYVLKIVGPRMMKEMILHGSLTWIETTKIEEGDGNIRNRHIVRSPIVVTSLSSQALI